MLPDANDGGVFLRIQKANAKLIRAKKLQSRKLDIKIIITY